MLLLSLVFCYKYACYFEKQYFHLHSIIDRPLIISQLPRSSDVGYWLISITDSICIAPTNLVLGFFSVVTAILLSNFHLIFEKNPCTCTPKFRDPWSILNYPGILLFTVNRFISLTPDLLLPPTRSLVFFCHHCSSAIKSSSGFRKTPLHLHSTIYRPLIIPSKINRPLVYYWSPWYSAVDSW